ncbi:helix-turn-helix domain-containing protein [Pediococcus pentosaceus]|jgi:transcriptional regulator with XRE-family HTH domain|uniref:Helix-turn-helix domain-containing protein n=1 Tax=Pediococcus pentosaceus TaxID=1255 RepID=A0A6L5A4E7_PEDPE|nr:helix-turn-helix transcriptional regulator [Pediococcus pentosaceus]KAF0349262.1 helix-turn-helix domain-containing protein [Pediococcus pentosaceus]KAF0415134.1 helix-turn-helix domain-containing protein [Pediococcus pentosaceus]KAF0501806.1 helix-turn-helix domain-containing protein [Pediococcus pentosaceus]MBF7105483.1 helix-turn-helix transcriptional regulator [Pediococcus pentosaceus]MBF7126400.1 helix-turn-helix transcriptional regulator [Pediococcus pentosaceus]
MTMFDRVKEISKKRGLSLAQLNEKAGFKQNVIYSWKTKTPSIDKVESVAKVLGVSVDYLLGKTEKEEPVNDTRDMEVEEALNSIRSYQGQPISDEEREVMRGIIKGYLDNKNKK